MNDFDHVEINPQFRRALDAMEAGERHVFVTGKAGTGKSTLLEYFRAVTGRRVAVVAPTGVAALNVKGQTIHSFFGFKTDVTPDTVKKVSKGSERFELLKKLQTLVVDEVSMVRADFLDCVERSLRLNGPHPGARFGGVKMVFIGDLYQLPPVVTPAERALFEGRYESPYFFSAGVFGDPEFDLDFIELEKIYRQTDGDFIELLNAIRNRSADEEDLERLNARCDPDFEPSPEDFTVVLTSTNDQAFQLNRARLEGLRGRAKRYAGAVEGDFEASSLPTDEVLELKKDAQVMLLVNDRMGQFVNGTIGRVVDFLSAPEESDHVLVELPDGDEVEVGPFTWEIFRYDYDRDSGKISAEPVGSFTQYPLKLAWAVTIHKSQGKTFDRVVIDVGRGTFAHGQVYVALSRCRTFDGIVLKRPIKAGHIRMDWRVVRFLTRFQYEKAERRMSYADRKALIEEAIRARRPLEIVYLKPDDTKSRRRIRPEAVEMMEYHGRTFEGLRAWCFERNDTRHFRIERILEIKES